MLSYTMIIKLLKLIPKLNMTYTNQIKNFDKDYQSNKMIMNQI